MRILKAPFSRGGMGKTEGCEKAPDKIIEQCKDLYLNESGFVPSFETKEIEIEQDNIETTNKAIYEAVKKNSEDIIAPRTCLLGGDHSITYASFKGFASRYNGAGLIVFDAHPDCENDFSPPTHEDYLKVLIKEGTADKNRVILVGIRNWTGEEKEFLEQNGIKYFSMKQIMMHGINDIMDTITETVREWGESYLSIDIDVCDPAFAPGTGYTEPGGLTAREMIYAIQRLKLLKNIRMIDIVEVNPNKDINDMTSKLAAKIMTELA